MRPAFGGFEKAKTHFFFLSIKTHHPTAMANPNLKEFFKEWLNQSASDSPLAPKPVAKPEKPTAKIIPFRPRGASATNNIECVNAVNKED